jgi:hypothetical protein
MLRTRGRSYQVIGCIVIAGSVVGCGSSSASSDDEPIAWEASAETEAQLGIHSWRLEGTGAKASLSGLHVEAGREAVVFHATVARPGDRIVIDVDVPETWRFELAQGGEPVASRGASEGVMLAFSASAKELEARIAPAPALMKTQQAAWGTAAPAPDPAKDTNQASQSGMLLSNQPNQAGTLLSGSGTSVLFGNNPQTTDAPRAGNAALRGNNMQ